MRWSTKIKAKATQDSCESPHDFPFVLGHPATPYFGLVPDMTTMTPRPCRVRCLLICGHRSDLRVPPDDHQSMKVPPYKWATKSSPAPPMKVLPPDISIS